MAAKSGQNEIFPLGTEYCCTTMWVKKFVPNHSILYGFKDIHTFSTSYTLQFPRYSPDKIFLGQGRYSKVKDQTRLGQLSANISPDRSSLTPQVLIGNFLFNPFVVCHKYWEKLHELQHINLLSLYLPKEDGVSPDVEYITQQIIFSIFLQ